MSFQDGEQIDQLLPDDEFPALDDVADFDDDDLFDAEPLVVESDDQPIIGKSWAFDFVSGRFQPRPGGGPQETRGLVTLRYWVEKCLRTPRGAFPIYNENYGIEHPDMYVGEQVGSPAFASLPDQIREALTFHPRITQVRNFQIEQSQDDEAVYISFEVITDQDETLPFTNFLLA